MSRVDANDSTPIFKSFLSRFIIDVKVVFANDRPQSPDLLEFST